MSHLLRLFALLAVAVGILAGARAAVAVETVVFVNADVFDSRSGDLLQDHSVVVTGNRIESVVQGRPEGQYDRFINVGGRVMLPGFIDTHVHLSVVGSTHTLNDLEWDYLAHKMAERSRAMLLRGFTTVRDLGGPVFGLRRAIEEGIVMGPRIFPSGAFVTQTGGHGDFRHTTDGHPLWHGLPSQAQALGYFRLADGVPAVLASVREKLRKGATQIKIMASGGVGSEYDPIDSVQYTPDEIQAAVQAAADWGTYVAAHLHNAKAIVRSVENGVRSVDHGFMINEDGARLMAEKNAYLSTQYAILDITLELDFLTADQLAKAREVIDASSDMTRLAKKHGVKVAFGTDSFGPAALAASLQNREWEARAQHFSNAEVLQQATLISAELVELAGKRNPYPGKLGVIEAGAMADILIVDGNPLEQIDLLAAPERNLVVIMKDGKIHKNMLEP